MMYRKILVVGFCFCLIFKLHAQYPAALIPDSLKTDAKAVIRLEEEVYEIKSPGKATEHERHVYTILDEDQRHLAHYESEYDKFTSINNITATLYDAAGKEIKRIKKKDMSDESGSDEETLMTDTRYKACNLEYGIYPYTTSFEEEDDIDGIFHLPYWYPQPHPGISVEDSRLVIITPKDYVLRYKAFNFPQGPVITEQSDKKIYTWEIKNLPAKKAEDFAPNWQELVPYVNLQPSTFEVGGYKGDLSTWEDFGKFINNLNEGKDVLPDAVKQKVHQLADNVTDVKEKIKVLYNFLQQNTRYINISFGIGGWQPHDANYVCTNHYGDCKALSNFMVALLKEAGIRANYVLIRAGEDAVPMMTDFPNSAFNHATVCVPMLKDTMWLECTSQTVPAGYIGSFTGNRNALLINETGGHIVSTTKYTAKDNQEITHVSGQIDQAGKLTANIATRYTGYQYFDAHEEATVLSRQQQLDILKEEINLATYDVNSFSYDDHKDGDIYIDQHIQVTADGCASVTGKRLFFTPNFLTQTGVKLQSSDKRKFDVVYRNDFVLIDSLDFQMPSGYSVEAMPKDVVVNNKFGNYEIHFKAEADKVYVNRRYERTSNRFPPAEFNNLVKFYDDIYRADRSKIVFVKKDS